MLRILQFECNTKLYHNMMTLTTLDLCCFVVPQVLLSKGSGKPLGLKTLDDCLYE